MSCEFKPAEGFGQEKNSPLAVGQPTTCSRPQGFKAIDHQVEGA